MTRELINTPGHGKRLYAALCSVAEVMREMDPRVYVGIWGCEVNEYPLALKVGVHFVTHPKPETTNIQMPILNIGMFDRGRIQALLNEKVSEAFPDFPTVSVVFRITTYTHAGAMGSFNYIYSCDGTLGKEEIIVNTSEITLEEKAPEPVIPVVPRIDQIRQTVRDTFWPEIRAVCAEKGYRVPEWSDDFVAVNPWAKEFERAKYYVYVLGFNPDVRRESGTDALIARSIRKLGDIFERLRSTLGDIKVFADLSLSARMSWVDKESRTMRTLDTVPAKYDGIFRMLHEHGAGTAFMELTHGVYDVTRNDTGQMLSIMYTTRTVEDNGYPTGVPDLILYREFLRIADKRHPRASRRPLPTTCVMCAVTPRDKTTAWYVVEQLDYIRFNVLRHIKRKIAEALETHQLPVGEIPAAVWCLNVISPRSPSMISRANLQAFLDDLPLNYTPSLVRTLLSNLIPPARVRAYDQCRRIRRRTLEATIRHYDAEHFALLDAASDEDVDSWVKSIRPDIKSFVPFLGCRHWAKYNASRADRWRITQKMTERVTPVSFV